MSTHFPADESDRPPSVLLGFRGENVRSFRDAFELSLLATPMAEPAYVRHMPWRPGGKNIGVLPAAAVYGANASGKSNVLRVMSDMRTHVLFSFRNRHPEGGFQRRGFHLGADPSAPSRYEVELLLDGVRTEYGFVADNERVLEEWAVHYPHGKPAALFQRQGDDVELGAKIRSQARNTLSLLRSNSLFLSVDAAVKNPVLSGLSSWFQRNLVLAEAESRQLRQAVTTEMLEDEKMREGVLDFLRKADLGICNARRIEMDPVLRERFKRALRIMEGLEAEPEIGDEGPEIFPFQVRLTHGGALGPIEFETEDESLGTLVWFGLVGPILQSLARGTVFLADELDSSLHPDLVGQLVRLFQDPETNPRRAQLIFNSHDATLLGDSAGHRPLGRDQVWFTEKDGTTGVSRLYALSDLDPRKGEAVSRRYLAGRYGARPIVSHEEFAAAADLILSTTR